MNTITKFNLEPKGISHTVIPTSRPSYNDWIQEIYSRREETGAYSDDEKEYSVSREEKENARKKILAINELKAKLNL